MQQVLSMLLGTYQLLYADVYWPEHSGNPLNECEQFHIPQEFTTDENAVQTVT